MPFGLPDLPLTSELDAVNLVMKAKGLDLVTSIDLGDAEIADAAFHLNKADKEVQSKGWWFNKDYALRLSPNTAGEIQVPEGTLQVAPSYYNAGLEQTPFVERAQKLWDLQNQTFTWTSAQLVDITVRILFTDLPEVARSYIATLAAHRAQGTDRGNQTILAVTKEMVLEALTAMEWEQDKAAPNNSIHDNLSVQGAINGFGALQHSRST